MYWWWQKVWTFFDICQVWTKNSLSLSLSASARIHIDDGALGSMMLVLVYQPGSLIYLPYVTYRIHQTFSFTSFFHVKSTKICGIQGAAGKFSQINLSTFSWLSSRPPIYPKTYPRVLFSHLSECFNSSLETKTQSTSHMFPGCWFQAWQNMVVVARKISYLRSLILGGFHKWGYPQSWMV